MTHTTTLTLSRWHKVAERLNAEIAELSQRAEKSAHLVVSTMQQQSVSSEDVQKLRTQVRTSIESQAELFQDVAVIRQALAEENIRLGISKSLTEMEVQQRQYAALKKVLSAIEAQSTSAMTVENFKSVNVADQRYGHSNIVLKVLEADDVQVLQDSAAKAKRESVRLSDEVASKNGGQLKLTISENAAKVASLV